MSVVVRIEMPKSCLDCPCVNGEYGYCQADKEERQIEDPNERPSWCPIICSLTEGHGRLVDADANFLGVIHLDGGGFANYNTTIAERIGEEDMRMVKVIVPADTAERSET